MRSLLVVGLLLPLTASAFAQTDRQVANDAIASALEDIGGMTPNQTEWTGMTQAQYEERIQSITERIEQLRDLLSNNGYVRVSGFSLGVPLGASISFEFID